MATSTQPQIVPGQWIVTLRPYATSSIKSSHVSLLHNLTEDSASPVNVSINSEFDLPEIRGYSASFDEATKAELEALPEVAEIEPVQIFKHCAVVQSDAPWGLARISTRSKLPAAGPYTYKYTNTGEGAIAYVIDTGINDAHVDFEGRASKGPKFVTVAEGTVVGDEDLNGHGTHVAGTIAGKTYGVAKKAQVIGIKVFDDSPEPGAQTGDIISALDYVVKEFKTHGKPSVVNLSLGGGASPAMDKAVASAVRSGVTVVVAAGNEARQATTSSPAREPFAITVGASDVTDKAAPFSNYGKVVDIFAPGVKILSTWIGGTEATNTISGTSMASPHVAGAVAQIIAAEPTEPLLVVPKLLQWAEKNDLTGLKERTINALLQVSDA
ncbi:putative alkaline serine protease [Triangularia verruculosa]|uniref:Alkaline serine protease n=1 Tax=Triangularia verruculosa TaxID=2587418 RepID=A0AAN6XRQ6_9PEZI|nr:putative alkaline serine protease [Triangularia verruculosa]